MEGTTRHSTSTGVGTVAAPAPGVGGRDRHRAPHRDTVVVALDDASLLEGLSQLRTTVSGHLLDGGSRVVVDIAGISRLSSATVAALLWTKRHCRSRGGQVIVRGPSQDSLNMLNRAGLSGVFDIQLANDLVAEGSGR